MRVKRQRNNKGQFIGGVTYWQKKYPFLEGNSNLRKKLYKAWKKMRERCLNKNNKDWNRYGGRGITICKEWNSFYVFAKDMHLGCKPEYTLDRIDNDGNYFSQNCKWSTRLEQSNNQNRTIFIEYKGIKKTITDWANYLNFPRRTLEARIYRGWSAKKSLFTPLRTRRF